MFVYDSDDDEQLDESETAVALSAGPQYGRLFGHRNHRNVGDRWHKLSLWLVNTAVSTKIFSVTYTEQP